MLVVADVIEPSADIAKTWCTARHMFTANSKARPGGKVLADKPLHRQAIARCLCRRSCRLALPCPKLHLRVEHVVVLGDAINHLLPAGRKSTLYDRVHGLGPRVCRAMERGTQPHAWLDLGTSLQQQWRAMYKQQLNTNRFTVVARQRARQATLLTRCCLQPQRGSPWGTAAVTRHRTGAHHQERQYWRVSGCAARPGHPQSRSSRQK